MGQYTEFLEDRTYNVYDEEDYLEAIEKTIKIFRSFDKALDSFLLEHGFVGNIDDEEDKIQFISDRFKAAGVPVPRNIKKWYSEHKAIERKTAFQICFAFELEIEEVDDFLRRICLYRGFDCHSMDEVIYFFAFKNHLKYDEVQEIKKRLGTVKQGKLIAEDIIYTDVIADDIGEIETEQELIEYLTENSSAFEYNNATACKVIKSLWKDISDEQGLAVKERQHLYRAFDDEDKEITNDEQCKQRKERKRVNDSLWEIYLQMLGLSGNYSSKFYKARSIKSILKDSTLLHPLAEDSFPDRDGLNKILNGEHVSYERVRKILILLVFYRFWANKALTKNNYCAEYGDADRCRDSIDDYLLDAGYPCLYAGNPYDFIILFASNSEMPLFTFREYMRELYFMKKGENCSD